MIRDVAVKVPEPEDFITDAIFPSHIVVPRCSGGVLSRTTQPSEKTSLNESLLIDSYDLVTQQQDLLVEI